MVEDGGERNLDRAVALSRALEDARTDEPEVVGIRLRLAAVATDFGFAFVCFFAIFGLIGLVIAVLWGLPEVEDEEWPNPDPRTIAVLVTSVAAWLGLLAVQNVTGIHGSGLSLGKESLNLRLVRSDGTPVSIRRRLGRWGTAMAVVVTAFAALAAIAPRLNSDLSLCLFVSSAAALLILLIGRGPRGIHDLIWDTKVISPRSETS